MEKSGVKIAAQNRKAYHDYFVEDRYEAGIELFGTEVKSVRAGTLNLKDSFCVAKDGEVYAYSLHISPYDHGNIFNRDPDRPKRLLLHKREIRKLHDLQKQDGYALIPLSVYFRNSRVKVELGLCKGKKTYDKRDAVAKRDAKREMWSAPCGRRTAADTTTEKRKRLWQIILSSPSRCRTAASSPASCIPTSRLRACTTLFRWQTPGSMTA